MRNIESTHMSPMRTDCASYCTPLCTPCFILYPTMHALITPDLFGLSQRRAAKRFAAQRAPAQKGLLRTPRAAFATIVVIAAAGEHNDDVHSPPEARRYSHQSAEHGRHRTHATRMRASKKALERSPKHSVFRKLLLRASCIQSSAGLTCKV